MICLAVRNPTCQREAVRHHHVKSGKTDDVMNGESHIKRRDCER